MSEYMMFTSLQGKRYFDASLKYQYAPTEENKKILDDISEEINKDLQETQERYEKEFIELYGIENLEFIRKLSLGKHYFLIQSQKFVHRFTVVDDEENDEYESVLFSNGKFYYLRESYSGYGETVWIENDITKKRVLELLKIS